MFFILIHKSKRKKMNFKTRGFVSITLLISFIVISISGIVLYIMPHGRVAYWTNWKMVGLNKDDWDAVHTVFGIVFMLMACVHFYLNWKPFVSYLKSKVQKGIRCGKELAASVCISGILVVGTLGDIPPFSTIMNVGESIKKSWVTTAEEPPVPHFELITFDELIKQHGESLEDVVQKLEKQGICINNTIDTLKTIAEENDLSPMELYKKIIPEQSKNMLNGRGLGPGEGRGLGRGQGRGSRR
ncbi:DUF4405 domain-containing protein [Candidatus Latescibacterota bacterium]